MSFIVKPCPCEPDCIGKVSSTIGPTTCSFVVRGFCPQGYYCPTYSPILLNSPVVANMLTNNSCVIGPSVLNITRSPQVTCCVDSF